MTFIPDLSERLYASSKFADTSYKYLSVGWLGDRVETEGETTSTIFEQLLGLRKENPIHLLYLDEEARKRLMHAPAEVVAEVAS